MWLRQHEERPGWWNDTRQASISRRLSAEWNIYVTVFTIEWETFSFDCLLTAAFQRVLFSSFATVCPLFTRCILYSVFHANPYFIFFLLLNVLHFICVVYDSSLPVVPHPMAEWVLVCAWGDKFQCSVRVCIEAIRIMSTVLSVCCKFGSYGCCWQLGRQAPTDGINEMATTIE